MRSKGGLAFLALVLPAEAFAATRTVCASGCDFSTFVAAAAAAVDTDVIEFRDSGTYAGTDITKNITVQALGANTPTINTRLHVVNKTVTVSGVRLAGSLNHCVEIDAGSNVTIRNLTIENCSGAGGGGIYASVGATATTIAVDTVLFQNNTSTVDGGHIGVTGNVNLTVTGSTFLADTTTGKGGAIASTRAGQTPSTGLIVSSSTFTGSSAAGLGGAIFSDMTTLVTGSWFTTTRTTTGAGNGGAIYMGGTLTARRNVFCKTNSGGYGAIYLAGDGADAVTNNIFIGNTAVSGGGALFAFSAVATPVVAFNHFLSNSAPIGGALWIRGNTSSFHSNLIAYNTGGGATGAVYGLGALSTRYSLYYSNVTSNTGGLATTSGSDIVGKDPVLNGYDSKNAPCGKADIDELYPEMYSPSKSPLIDAADPAYIDLDGSRADIGAFGGGQVDPAVWADVDKDGYRAWVDCNDADATKYPVPLFTDSDGDGYGGASAGTECLSAGFVTKSGDCDDAKSAVNPGATELCSTVGVDDNCNGSKDEGTATDAASFYADADLDTWGTSTVTKACSQPPAHATRAGDCDDTKSTINPGASELCSTVGVDDNCNGSKDETSATDALTWYVDADADKYGTTSTTKACTQPVGYANNNKDCNDGNAGINPAAFELCATVGVDDNCDGSKDEATAKDVSTWYVDADADTWGAAATAKQCAQPAGYVNRTGDCNDGSKTVSPSAVEVCGNGVDDNCDGAGGGANADDDGDKLTYAQEQLAKSNDCLTDSDSDGLSDFVEFGPGPAPRDTDSDGYANAVDADDDADRVPTLRELAAGSDPLLVDSDNDLVPDGDEWGPAIAAQDTDNDGTPDVLDDDDDGDGIPTVEEGTNDFECGNKSCKLACDGIPNFLDLDSDGDGKSDASENSGDLDLDDDGVDNYLDCNDDDGGLGDNDGDGLTNAEEAKLGTSPTEVDTDGDGIDDLTEVDSPGAPQDTDDDGVIDARDTDDDGDGFDSIDEIGAPLAPDDTDEDGVFDYLDDDDDGDGVPSGVELDGDQDDDGIPNFLDADDEDGPTGDADADGLSNQDELDAGTDPLNTDSDADGVPDEIEVGDVSDPTDSDSDGTIDAQDDDDDQDGVPTAEEGGFDLDGDGLPNHLDTDSDGDGVADGTEPEVDLDCDGAPAFLDVDETDGPCLQDPRELPDPDGVTRTVPSCSTASRTGLWQIAGLILIAVTRRRSTKSPSL